MTLPKFYTPIIILFFISCNDLSDKKKELELRERELDLRQKEIELKSNDNNTENNVQNLNTNVISKLKYIFIVAETKELKKEKGESITTGNWSYTSDIIKIDDFSEDKKYLEIDKLKDRLQNKISNDPKNKFIKDLNSILKGLTDVDGNEPSQYSKWVEDFQPEIISVRCFEFDSYKDATLRRQSISSE